MAYRAAQLAQKTGISASTLYREFKKLDIARGSITKDTLDSAKQALLEQSGLVGDLKSLIASQINDDLSLARQLRIGLTIAIHELINNGAIDTAIKCRSFAAIATSMKASSDLMRRALQIDDSTTTVSEIPTLTIRRMDEDEIREAQNSFNDNNEPESLGGDLLLTAI